MSNPEDPRPTCIKIPNWASHPHPSMPKFGKKSQQPQRKSATLQVPGTQPSYTNFVHPNEDPQEFRGASPSFVHPPQHFVPRISPSHSLEHMNCDDDSKLPSFSELVASLSATQLSPHPSPLHSPSPSPRHSSHRPSYDFSADRHISASSSPRRSDSAMRDSPYGTPVCLSPETTPRGSKMDGTRSPLNQSRGNPLPFDSRPFTPSSSSDPPPQFVLSDPPMRSSSSFDKSKRGSSQRPSPLSPPFLSPDITPTVSAHGTPKHGSPFISPETTPRGMSLDAGDPRYASGRPYLPDVPLPRTFFSPETTARLLDSSNMRSARVASPNRGTYPFANEPVGGFPYSPPDSNSTFVYPPEHNSAARIKSPTRGRSFDAKGSR